MKSLFISGRFTLFDLITLDISLNEFIRARKDVCFFREIPSREVGIFLEYLVMIMHIENRISLKVTK